MVQQKTLQLSFFEIPREFFWLIIRKKTQRNVRYLYATLLHRFGPYYIYQLKKTSCNDHFVKHIDALQDTEHKI